MPISFALRMVFVCLLIWPMLARAVDAKVPMSAENFIPRPISFVYAVYWTDGVDKVTLARFKADASAAGAHVVERLPKSATNIDVAPAVITDVAKQYVVPDLTSLQYFGRGLTHEQAVAVQKSKGVLILQFQYPSAQWKQGLRAATLLAEKVAGSKGFIWDEETRELFTPAAWHERRLDGWSSDIPDMTRQTVIHAYKGSREVRAITLGMKKFDLPDIVIDDFAWSNAKQMGHLLNGVMQALVEGARPQKPGEMTIDFSTLKHSAVKAELLQDLEQGATGTVKLQLVRGTPEEGDPANRLMEIEFDRYPGPDRYARQNALVSSLFGAKDAVSLIKHDEKLLAASHAARAKLPELRKAFNQGLAPGEFIQLKVPFKIRGDRNEWMWVEVISWTGSHVRGLLKNEPFEIPTLHAGQMVDVDEDKVFDYIRTRADGSQTGNETSRIIQEMNAKHGPMAPQR